MFLLCVLCVVCSIYMKWGGAVDLENLSLPLLWTQPNLGINPISHPNYVTVSVSPQPQFSRAAAEEAARMPKEGPATLAWTNRAAKESKVAAFQVYWESNAPSRKEAARA